MSDRLTLIAALILALALFACATTQEPAGDEPVVGQGCVVMRWDFASMEVPPPNLKGPRQELQLTMARATRLQQPQVLFRHASHDTLPCKSCHPSKKNKLITVIDFTRSCPHSLCMGCHQQMTNENRGTGPVECQGCHQGPRTEEP